MDFNYISHALRLAAVVQSIYAISAISRQHNFGGPFIGVAYADANKRHFTKEQLAKAKAIIPMFNRGAKKMSADWKQDLIVKTKITKHSNVQSVWEQGAIAMETGNTMDRNIKNNDGMHRKRRNAVTSSPLFWD